MTEEKKVYVIAHLNEDADRRFDALYRQLAQAGFGGTQIADFPHHITLGTYELAQEKRALQLAREASDRFCAFEIRYTYLGMFGQNVLFAAPSMNRELVDLHDAVMPDVPAAGEHEWVAHTTLLMDEPQALLRAVPLATKAFVPFTAKVVTVGVYEFTPPRSIIQFPLQSGCFLG